MALRGLSFERAAELDWLDMLVWTDERREYGEPRYSGLSMLEGRLHAITFTYRAGAVRVISFRKANRREEGKYAKKAKRN